MYGNSSRVSLGACALCVLAACGGGGGSSNNNNGPPPTFTVGGTVTGLSGSGLVLRNNTQELTIGAGGTFSFPTALASGSAYNVSVVGQPESPAQECAVINGSGTLGNGNVTNVTVQCTTLPALTLASSTPVNGATDLIRTGSLVLNFSAALNAASVGANTVMLRDAARTRDVAVTVSGSQITVTPQKQLLPASAYTLTVNQTVRGSGRQELSAPITIRFATRGSWQTARLLENDAAIVYEHQLATNGDTTVAVWTYGDHRIALSRYVPGSGWSSPESNLLDAYPELPALAIDSRGTAHVVWMQMDQTAIRLRSSRHAVASGWTAPEPVPMLDTGSASTPSIVVDTDGNALAIWRQASSPSYIYANRYSAGSGWGTMQGVDSGVNGRNPQIAATATGNVIAVWTQLSGGRVDVFSNRYTVGSGWDVPVRVNTEDVAGARDANLVVDAAGNATAVYRVTRTGDPDTVIAASRYTSGSGWSAPVQIDSAVGPATPHQIAIDPAGNITAIWLEQRETDEVWSNRYTVGTGWGTAQRIALSAGSVSIVKLAVDEVGNALAVWDQTDGNGVDSIMAIRYVAGTGWGTAEPLDTRDTMFEPRIAIDTAGNAVAVWQRHSDGVLSLAARHFE